MMASEKKLIDAHDAVRLLRGKCVAKYPNSFLLGLLAAASEIEEMPEAEPVKRGRWVSVQRRSATFYECSLCNDRWNYGAVIYLNYCPNCGAKMDLED